MQELIKYPFFADMVTKLKITDLTFEAVSTSTPLRLFSIEPSLFNACFFFFKLPFDEDMEELLASIKNKKKLTSSDTVKSKKKAPKKTSNLLSRGDSVATMSSQATAVTPTSSQPKTPTSTTARAPPPPATSTSFAPPPPPPPAPISSPPSEGGRSGLLNSIAGFSGGLKKVKTNDRSGPSY